jgi:hypothetical protein
MNIIKLWLHKNLENIAIGSVVFAILWVFFGPILLTKTNFCLVDFGGSENNTGIIGDTIGGITSPVVGLISILLLYFALIKQIESNKLTEYESNFKFIYNEIQEIKKNLMSYTYRNQFGQLGLTEFVFDFGLKVKTNTCNQYDLDDLSIFVTLINQFHKIDFLLENLTTSDNYKKILTNDLQNIYVTYLADAQHTTQQEWVILPEEIITNFAKGQMFLVKNNLSEINNNIIKRSVKNF